MRVRCCTIAAAMPRLSINPVLTPARRRGHEILDNPSINPALAVRSLRDVALANALFGGRRAIVRELRALFAGPERDASLTLVDVGTGVGDIPAAAQRLARRCSCALTTIGVELDVHLARAAMRCCTRTVAANALSLPFATGSIDIITCSQVLHHFEDDDAVQLLRECARVSRRVVVIGDLRRSWLAVAGLWTTSFLLGFHPVSRHDGVVSILRGFTRDELASLIEKATGARAVVRHSLGWRVTATWTTSPNFI